MSTETIEPMNGVAAANNRLPSPGLSQGVSKLASDLLTLVELQGRLLVLDARQTISRSYSTIGLAASALVLAIAAAVVALVGLGFALASAFGWPVWVGFLACALISFAISSMLLVSATQRFKNTTSIFARSQVEFGKNLESFKASLSSGENVAATKA